MTKNSRVVLVLVSLGWIAYWWLNANDHHFSSGSTELAIAKLSLMS